LQLLNKLITQPPNALNATILRALCILMVISTHYI
jgi:hypothetical protein